MSKERHQLEPEIEEPRIMAPADQNENRPGQSLILRPSSGLVGLPEGRSAPLEEMILRSLDHLSDSAELIALEPRPGEERDFQIAPGLTMRMCWCPPGEFLMGSPESEAGRWDHETQVRVVLSKGFWIGKTQVTQAQWEAVMGENPSRFEGSNRPVDCVSWHDTQEFLERVNLLIGDASGERMTLPTEAQWEYAARAGQAGMYAGGSLNDVAWYTCNSESKTHPVGTKKANAWGLHDMCGNVWEWCQDWYDDELLGGNDPIGPGSGSGRVIRGGCWNLSGRYCRLAYRDYFGFPSIAVYGFGFRAVRI
jgi:formylglycine-generating enzyme required for sulfatase activity